MQRQAQKERRAEIARQKQQWIDKLEQEIVDADSRGETKIKLPMYINAQIPIGPGMSELYDIRGKVRAYFRKQGYTVQYTPWEPHYVMVESIMW